MDVRRVALYLGGFLGPFGGGVIAVLIPDLRETFHASTAAVTAGLTVYLLPFAGLQLVSGTIGERAGWAASWGRSLPCRRPAWSWRRCAAGCSGRSTRA